MLRTIATGLLARRLTRGVYRMTPNPIVRAAGMAAAGMLAARLLRPKRGTRGVRAVKPGHRRGVLARAW